MNLSSGRLHLLAISLVQLLENPSQTKSELAYVVGLKSEAFTSSLFSEVIDGGKSLGLIESNQGDLLGLTRRGNAIASLALSEGEPKLKRKLLAETIKRVRKDLLVLAFSGRDGLDKLGRSEFQCFEQLGLADYRLTEEASAWWESLRNAGGPINSEILKIEGDKAESASLKYEENRLGHLLDSNRKVDWVSRETDMAGFDILSFSGLEPDPFARKPIEVKKLSRGFGGEQYFFLSRNEFRAANETEGFTFHLWEFGESEESSLLWIPVVEKVLGLTPINRAPGEWESCRIVFDSGLQETSQRISPFP
jgi:hypothetical protein